MEQKTLETLLDESLANSVSVLQNSKLKLAEYAQEDGDIGEFIAMALDFGDHFGQNARPGAYELRTMLWAISGIELSKNPYHDTCTLKKLHTFVGGYLLDDSYFVVEKRDSFFTARGVGDDCETGTQDPRALIDAALSNHEYNKNPSGFMRLRTD